MSSNPDMPSTGTLFKWGLALIAFFVVLSTVLVLTGAAGNLFDIFVNRKAVEQSVQYSETNKEAFYLRLESVKKIEIQLAEPDLTPEKRSALESQKSLLESEMRREVAKIPRSTNNAPGI